MIFRGVYFEVRKLKSQITLRQNKIIQILRNKNSYMTSDEIAALLNVSSKTVRTDIADINRSLCDEGIAVDSVKSKGFILTAKDPEVLKKFSKDHKVFMGRADRVYYLAVRLCTSDEPLDLYDLEDEMAVSSSTLSSDLTAFKNRFVHGVPNIELNISKNALMLEKSELKRRFILTKLLSDNWDYNSTGNVYYESDFIDSGVFNIINANVAKILFNHGIHLEDYHLITLNLNLSISYHRIMDGYMLESDISVHEPGEKYISACDDMFDILKELLDFEYPPEDRLNTALYLQEYDIPFGTPYPVRKYPDNYYEMADAYISRINDIYSLDFSDDKEFYNAVLVFISRMHRPLKDITVRETPDHIKHHMFVEHDIAVLFHRIGENEFPIIEADLLYLTYAVSAAMLNRSRLHPEKRFSAVVMCHMNINAMWSLRLSLENQFGHYLNVTDIIPVNHKDYYDFSKADLVLSTVGKKIRATDNKEVLQITPYLTKQDSHIIGDYIRGLRIQRLYPKNVKRIHELLDDAYVHEKKLFSSRYDLIEYMCGDFIKDGIFNEDHMFSITKRESVSSFAHDPAVLLLYSTTPGTKTKLSLLTLDHRIMWNNYKIRIVFLISLAKEDMNELFYLQNTIFHKCYDIEKMKHLKTLEEIQNYYKTRE